MVDLWATLENINIRDVYLIVEPLGWCDFNLAFYRYPGERNDVLNGTCLSWACILFIDAQYNVGVWIGSMIRLIRFMRHDH
jgi:hypothetical protein